MTTNTTSHYPFGRIFVGHEYTIAIAGSTIQLLSTVNGQLLHSASGSEVLIRGVEVTKDYQRVITADDSKLLRVWVLSSSIDGVKLVLESVRELPKKSSEVHLTADGQTILASDKFGDIYSYPINSPPATTLTPIPAISETEKASEKSSPNKKPRKFAQEKPTEGILVLGHTSVVTAFTLTPDERFIITSDRDEHIRVSWFPQGHVVERFCFGHRKYISAIHIPCFDPSMLISGGGDSDLYVFNWVNGELLSKVPVYDLTQPLVKIQGGRRTYIRYPRRPDGQGLSRKAKKSKAKIARIPREYEVLDNANIEYPQLEGSSIISDQPVNIGDSNKGDDKNSEGDMEGLSTADTPVHHGPSESGVFDPEESSLVISKIGSLEVQGHNLVLFTAVGISGLFYFDVSVTTQDPKVEWVDLSSPIMDFFSSSTRSQGEVWVSLDNEWKTRRTGKETQNPAVELLRWNDEKLSKVTDVESALITTLNTSARVLATVGEVEKLELYMSLATLPKSREEEAEGETEGNDDSIGIEVETDLIPIKVSKDDVKKAERDRAREALKKKLRVSEPGQVGIAEIVGLSARHTPDSETPGPEPKKPKVTVEDE